MLMEHGATSSLEERRWMAKEAFAVSSHYDSAIFNYFDAGEGSAFRCSVNSQKQLRYGENPHQKGYFYGNLEAMFDQIHGKEISYNNLVDFFRSFFVDDTIRNQYTAESRNRITGQCVFPSFQNCSTGS